MQRFDVNVGELRSDDGHRIVTLQIRVFERRLQGVHHTEGEDELTEFVHGEKLFNCSQGQNDRTVYGA